jgi:acetyl esterase/lipase
MILEVFCPVKKRGGMMNNRRLLLSLIGLLLLLPWTDLTPERHSTFRIRKEAPLEPRARRIPLEEFFRNPEKDKEQLIKTSPVFNADKIRAPLFIAQGGNDPRVNRSESDSMVEAMKKRGVDVEYILKMDEGHSIQKAENKIEIMEKVERFLKKYLH